NVARGQIEQRPRESGDYSFLMRVPALAALQSDTSSQLALHPGARLGPYEINVLLGVGGMGEVYRATDTNLKRQVALKALPAAFGTDADRLARFQREAEVLAKLNDPHIAQIYGLEKADGVTALVMELVQFREDFRFALKPCEAISVGYERRGEGFERDL